jgi:hypothetical protein
MGIIKVWKVTFMDIDSSQVTLEILLTRHGSSEKANFSEEGQAAGSDELMAPSSPGQIL